MAKKFSIKKLAAGVLALLMVVTALPVSGVAKTTAKAADDAGALTVYRSYNPNNGEHLLTVTESEHRNVVSLGYNDEGTAWYAPSTSATPIYRAYNPNSGEHLLVPKEEAEWLEKQGWNNEGIKMYSDDDETVPVYRVYNPNAKDAGGHLYTNNKEERDYLVAQGWTADNGGEPVLYGTVKEDLSSYVVLTDINGLQADGTALTDDTLALVFGANFGVPKSLAWYKDGAVVSVTVSNIQPTNLTITPGTNPGAGEYYAIVENTEGKTYQSNKIVVVEEGVAVIEEAYVEDNFEALAKVVEDPTAISTYGSYLPETAADVTTSVINITLNKDYEGTFYVVKADTEKFADIGSADDFTPAALKDNGASAATRYTGNTLTVTKKSEFTDENLAKQVSTESANYSDFKAIKYVNKDGSVSYKILAQFANTKTLTRGTEYIVIFDQDSSVKTGSTVDDWNISEAFTVPYLPTPTEIKVTDVQTQTNIAGWTLTAYLGEDQAAYLGTGITGGAVTGTTDIESHLYTSDSAKNSDGTKFGTDLARVIFGKGTSGANATAASTAKGTTSKTYVYGTMKIKKGICGEEAVELTSDVVAVTDNVAESVSVAPSSTDAKDMEVTILKLRANATAYLVYGGNASGNESSTHALKDAFDVDDEDTYIASAELEKGTTSYTFEDAVEKFENTTDGDAMYVVLVPENTEEYAETWSAVETITQKETTYSLSGTTEGITGSAGTGAYLHAYDQYGNEMDKSAETTPKDISSGFVGYTDKSEKQTVTIAVAAGDTGDGGAVTLAFTDGSVGASAGDVYSYRITNTQTIKITCTTKGKKADSKWKITIE